MNLIYVGSTEKVYINIYKDGVATDADALPTYSITIVGSDAAARTGTAIAESTGVYYVLTEFDEVSVEQTLRVEWSYVVDTASYTKVNYVSVVTPYASHADIKAIAPAGTSDEEIENAEVFARLMIEAYTGTHFGLKVDTINMHGNDKNTLVLPHRIVRLDELSVNDEVLYTRDPEVNNFGRTLTITDTNYGILTTKYDDVPVWGDYIGPIAWKKNWQYGITGQFGWEHVPDEVEYCARLLADDYFCKETAWKKRFVEQINASDWRIVFNQKQFQGTGNFFVDQILRDFRSIGMVII